MGRVGNAFRLTNNNYKTNKQTFRIAKKYKNKDCFNKHSIFNRGIKADEVGGNVPLKQTVGVKNGCGRVFFFGLHFSRVFAPPVRPDLRPVGE